jgi:pheromone shutdown protein TraB
MRNYLRHIKLLGTAHWSQRSIADAIQAVNTTSPQAICLELDKRRFDHLRRACFDCLRFGNCKRKCEFVAAADALGNQEADIWLIDMDERDIARRVQSQATLEEIVAWRRIDAYVARHNEQGIRLWEEGLKQEALAHFNGGTELMYRAFPTLWRVLIKERNLVMAARLIFITEQYIQSRIIEPNILTLVGAAHVQEIKELLTDPTTLARSTEQSGIEFTPPTRIHRLKVL